METGMRERRCVLVGGSSGIGLAAAEILIADGAHVLLVGRSEERLAAARQACAGRSGLVETLAADVTSPDAPSEILAAAEERLGGIDGLVNSAGSSRGVALEDVTDAEWEGQWELNVTASRRLMDAAAPRMAAQEGGGAIVNVCSSAGRRPSSRDPAYAVAKRGQLALTDVYAQRYRGTGVRISAVAPGPTETDLWLAPGGLLDQAAAESGSDREEALRAQGSKLPLGRLADPAEVAAVVVLLLAPELPGGALWSVDGGHVPDVFP